MASIDPSKIAAPHTFAPTALTKSTQASSNDTVLEACTVAGMVGVLHQLGELAAKAHEIFDGLTNETSRSTARIGALTGRLAAARDRCARVDEALDAAGAEELSKICSAAPGMEYKAAHEEQSGLFTAASRPASLQAAFDAAKPPPALNKLDSFVHRDTKGLYAKYGLVETCANGYSDKDFFVKQWLDEEERKVNALKAVRTAMPWPSLSIFMARPRHASIPLSPSCLDLPELPRKHAKLAHLHRRSPDAAPRTATEPVRRGPCAGEEGAQGRTARARGRRQGRSGKKGQSEADHAQKVPHRGGETGAGARERRAGGRGRGG